MENQKSYLYMLLNLFINVLKMERKKNTSREDNSCQLPVKVYIKPI